MKITQHLISLDDELDHLSKLRAADPQLVLFFASREFIEKKLLGGTISSIFPDSITIGCSTGGQITNDGVKDNVASATAIRFDRSTVKLATELLDDMGSSSRTGQLLGEKIPKEGLKAVLVFSVGLNVNGSALLEGLKSAVPSNVTIAGGLAADGADFDLTYVIANDEIKSDMVAAVALYGDVEVICGSRHGWEIFGPTRKVTDCDDNVLKTLDDQPALQLYKKYLGPYASQLPASALLFPLKVIDRDNQSSSDNDVIRTVLGVDEESGSITLAGSVRENTYLQMMHAGVENLIEGAEDAAISLPNIEEDETSLALLISCIGRILVMGDDADDEVAAVQRVLGRNIEITGYYSYGEISTDAICHEWKLHNQTMTISRIWEPN